MLDATFSTYCSTLGVVAEWSKVLTEGPWPFMVWSTLALGTYQLRFVSRVFHVIFSFVHFISLYTLGGLRAFRKPLHIICIYSIFGLQKKIKQNHLRQSIPYVWRGDIHGKNVKNIHIDRTKHHFNCSKKTCVRC